MKYPIVQLGSAGVITDSPPTTLDPGAISWASNITFSKDGAYRGNVLRTAGPLVHSLSPRYLLSYRQQTVTGTYRTIVCNDDGSAYAWTANPGHLTSSELDMTPTGYTLQSSKGAYTGTVMNGMVFLNRSDRTPWYTLTSNDQFNLLPNWDARWTCQSLRSLGPALVAINVTKAGTNYPTMVKTSDFCVFGSPPGTWAASPSNSATENILTDLSEPLVDGLPLRGSLVLYSNHETWLMTPSQDELVYDYERKFTQFGMISTNCGVEVNNSHYVFGYSDIWTHDGLRCHSIAVGRVRDFIFDYLVPTESHQFFVYHDDHDKEIGFCYISTDPKVHYPALVGGVYKGCNRSAVYNYAFDTWTFYDLPYVTYGTFGFGKASTSYDYYLALGTEYDEITETYDDLSNYGFLVTLMCNPDSGMQSFVRAGSLVDCGLEDVDNNAPVVCERQFINVKLAVPEIAGYKTITAVYPEVISGALSGELTFYVGSSDYYGYLPVTYEGPTAYNPYTDYKIDFTTSGRFLSLKFHYTGIAAFAVTGYDIDLVPTGHR